MSGDTLPTSYWLLAGQFLRLAHESCLEIVNSGNKFVVVSSEPISVFDFNQAIRWTDHSVGVGVLFSYFHGIELVLKGFLAVKGVRLTHHKLTSLLQAFESNFPKADLGFAIKSALPSAGENSPIGRFLASNSIQIDDWYEALKYPESKSGEEFDHFPLKFGGAAAISFWQEIYKSSADIRSKAVALSRQHGYE